MSRSKPPRFGLQVNYGHSCFLPIPKVLVFPQFRFSDWPGSPRP
jgi:hypothetical protein